MPDRIAFVRARSCASSDARLANSRTVSSRTPGHGAQFVALVVSNPLGEITRRDAPGRGRNRPEASAEQRRREPGEHQRARQRDAQRDQRHAADRGHLLLHLCQGEGKPDDPHLRVVHRHGDVQHVGLSRLAVAPRDADASRSRLSDLRPGRVVLQPGQRSAAHRRIADDGAIAGDERHARRQRLADPDRLVFDRPGRDVALVGREHVRHQMRFRDQRLLDAPVGLIGQGERQQRGHEQQGRRGDAEDGGEDLPAKPEGHRPTPRMGRPACSRTA